MRTKVLILAILCTVLATGFVQQRQIAALRGSVQEQRILSAEGRRLDLENAELRELRIDSTEHQRLQSERLELMKLRAEMPELREAGRTPEALEMEVRETREKAHAAQRRAEFILASKGARDLSKATRNLIESCMSAVSMVSHELEGQQPASWEELKSLLQKAFPEPHWRQWQAIFDGADFMGVSVHRFEFVPEKPGILLREREPRRLPDGNWAKYYGLKRADGRFEAEEVVLPENAFQQWEHAQL